MRRVEHSRLALGELWIAVTDEIVPERQYAGPQRIGKAGLLRQEVGVDIAADEPAPGPQRLPEDNRQQYCRYDRGTDHQHRAPEGLALAAPVCTVLAFTACRRISRQRVSRRREH